MPSKGQTYDSSGPDIRVRGNAYQVLEKYLQLARDAGTVGDRVAAENFLQHADHYYRVVAAMNEGQRPRIGGREVSVADINVQNGSQGLSAAMSGHGHGGGDDHGSDNQQGNGNGNGQMRPNQSQGGGESENGQDAEEDRGQQGNGSDDESRGNSAESAQTGAPDEQPDYPDELLPADAANAAPRDGQQDGRQQGRIGRGRRRGPGRRVRTDGDEAVPPPPPTTTGETQ